MKQYRKIHLTRAISYWTLESKWKCYNYMNYYYYGSGFYDLEEINNNPYGIMIEDRYTW